MSFKELLDASVAKKEKKFKVGKYDFIATEIGYLQRLHLANLQNEGGDAFSQLIVYSVKDQNGAHLTVEQISQLPDEYAEKFFLAATEVNAKEPEKN